MSDLPKGWTQCSLDNLLTALESGSRPRGGVKGICSGVPSLGGEHLTYKGGFDFSSIRYVPEEFADKMTKGRIKSGDILIVKDGATTGKTSFVDSEFPYKKAVVNEHVFICRPSPSIEPNFLFRYLTSQQGQKEILNNFQGSAQGGINLSFASNTKVVLPPLNEQRRIVAKLEKLLAKVNACGDRLDKIPTILKRFRQSVLAAACSGRLTADWREQHPAVPSWKKENLINLIEEKPRNGFSGKSVDLVDYETNTKVLTLTATTSGTFRHDCFKYLAQDIPLDSHAWLHPTNILIQRGNTIEYVGVSAIYTGEPFQFIYPDLMMKIRVKKEIADHKFIYFALSDIRIRNYFRDNATGTAGNMPKINQQVVMNTPIELPPLEEQKEIVRRVEALFQKCDQIKARYQKAKAYTDKLTQAILAKAFRGELVPQDPNDEPAEVLLERIKAEKAATQPQKKPRQPRSKKGKTE